MCRQRKDFVAAIDPRLDVILADFNLPAFGAPRALELLKARDIRVPLIVVSGSIGDAPQRGLDVRAADRRVFVLPY